MGSRQTAVRRRKQRLVANVAVEECANEMGVNIQAFWKRRPSHWGARTAIMKLIQVGEQVATATAKREPYDGRCVRPSRLERAQDDSIS